MSKPSKAPKSAFQLYCEEVRPGLETKHAHSDVNIDEELEKAWKDLPESEKDDYEAKLEQLQKAASEKGDAETEADVSSPKKDGDKTPDVKVKDDDEDVEMGNYDTEEQEAQADKDAEKDDDKNGDD